MYNIRYRTLISVLLISLLKVSVALADKRHDTDNLEKKQVDSLYNISKFVTWPHYIMDKNNLIFCFYGDNADKKQYNMLNGKSLHQRKIRVVHLNNLENAEDCQLLYTNITETDRLTTLTKLSKDNAILTVSSDKNFIKNGGMIHLQFKQDKMNLNINQSQVEAADLSVCSSLLNVSNTKINESL